MNSMPRSSHTNNGENSFGILNINNLKVFGDTSSACSNASSSGTVSSLKNVNDRLNAERRKALDTLEKPRLSNKYKNKNAHGNEKSTTKLVHPTVDSTNLSDLITDETIHLNSSDSITNQTTSNGHDAQRISFEPSEMTGRSTQCINEHQVEKYLQDNYDYSQSRNQRKNSAISVAEILTSSFAERAVNLAKKLNDKDDNKNYSCNLNRPRNLPRTTNTSFINSILNDGTNYSFSNDMQQSFSESNFNASGDFVPGELMTSQLVSDEIEWAHKFAAIPIATLSQQAKDKLSTNMMNPNQDIDASALNLMTNDPNFSLGNYFKERSDSLSQIAGQLGSNKFRMPSALVDHDGGECSTIASNSLMTPKKGNKTYTKVETSHGLKEKQQNDSQRQAFAAEQAKIRNNNSHLLSLSAIDKMLHNMNFDSDSDSSALINKLLNNKLHNINNRIQNSFATETDIEADAEIENKENCEPLNKHSATLSFSESVLNSTDFQKQLHNSISIPRSPLSPLVDLTPQPQIIVSHHGTTESENEGDIDEWPTTPIKSPNRRVIRTKSPHEKTPETTEESTIKAISINDNDEKTPSNKKINENKPTNRKTKSLSSTRLDSDVDVVSPNFSKNLSKTLIQTSCIVSPILSPKSCATSPLSDSTTNSDRRILMASERNQRKIITSPVSSETSSLNSGLQGAMRKATSTNSVARSISRCSSSSEFSHRDGKSLPLKVTRTQISWGSVKLRTDFRKSMQIKNISEKRLVVRICINGPGFQLVNGQNTILTLQTQECRTIDINFCPTICGVAVGMLSFYAPQNCASNVANISLLDIPLFGYGGSAKIVINGLLKGPVGSAFVPLGDVVELTTGPLRASFNLFNKGPLTAYAHIFIDTTVLMKPNLCDAFEVQPSKAIIPANNGVTFDIIFQPNRDDIKTIIKKTSQVLTLANMRIFYGDEPNRQRMRALVEQIPSEKLKKITSLMMIELWSEFPSECVYKDLNSIKDLPDTIVDLTQAVRINDVALTLNRDFNETAETSSLYFPDADESLLFKTICIGNSPTTTKTTSLQNNNLLYPVYELLEADTTTNSFEEDISKEGNWLVTPSMIELDVNTRNKANLIIINNFKCRQYFEVACNVTQLLRFTPSEGFLPPHNGQISINVEIVHERANSLCILNKDIIIMVYMESEKKIVPVRLNT